MIKLNARNLLIHFRNTYRDKFTGMPDPVIRWGIDGASLVRVKNWLSDQGGYDKVQKLMNHYIKKWDTVKSEIRDYGQYPTLAGFIYKRGEILQSYLNKQKTNPTNRMRKRELEQFDVVGW